MVKEIAEADTAAFRHVVPASVPYGSSPANRVIFPTPSGLSVRRALAELSDPVERPVIDSQGVPPQALAALRAGDDSGFVRVRADWLRERELEFMTRQGVQPPVRSFQEPLIDT